MVIHRRSNLDHYVAQLSVALFERLPGGLRYDAAFIIARTSNVRLSRSLCAVVGSVLAGTGSHTMLDALFKSAGAPGDPPDLAHHSKWKEWLFRAGQDSSVDSLAVLGNVLEEFMDMAPDEWDDDSENWPAQRGKIETALEQNGLRYFRFAESSHRVRYRAHRRTRQQKNRAYALQRCPPTSKRFCRSLYVVFGEPCIR